MNNAKEMNQNELKKLNKEELCKIVLQMQEMVQEKEETIAQKERTITEKDNRIDILTQEVQLLRAQRFGRKSEMNQAEAIKNGQIFMEDVLIFNEAEAVADTSAEKDQEITVKEHTRKKRPKGKQEEDLSKLRKEE